MPRSKSGTKGKETFANNGEIGQLFHYNPLPMWVYDLETLAFLVVNNAAIESYGFSEEEFLKMTIKDIRPAGEVPALLADIEKDRPDLEHAGEWRHRTKDGRIIIVEITSHLIEYKKRKAALVVAQDITQHKITELALRESEGRLRQQAELVENVTDAIISCDLDFHIITWNKAAEMIYGWKVEEVISRDLDSLSQTKYLDSTREKLTDELFTTEKWSGELEQTRKDGRLIYVQSHISIVRNQNGLPIKLVSVNRNISERRVTEAALRESEQRFRAAFEQSAVGVTEVTPEGVYRNVNKKFCEIVGYSEEELIGHTYYEITHQADINITKEKNAALLRGEMTSYSLEKRFVRKDGFIVWVNLSVGIVPDENGKPKYLIGVSEDITERKTRERELEALYQSGTSLRQVSDPKAVARKVIELLEQHMEWHHAAVWIRQGKSENIEQLAYSQVDLDVETIQKEQARSQAMVRSIHTGLAGWVIGHGKAVRNGDVANDSRYAKVNESIQSGLYVPLKVGKETIGCITAESTLPDAFNAYDERLLTTVAAQAAIALENARLYQASRRAAVRRDILYRASREIAHASQDVEQVYATVHRVAKKLMPADVFTIARSYPEQNEIHGVYLFDRGKRLPLVPVPFGEGLSGRVIASGKSILIADYLAQNNIKSIKIGDSEERARSILAVPIRVGNEVIGVISVQSYEPGVYTKDDEVLLAMLASYTGVTIQNADLFEQTRYRAAQLVRINDLGRAMAETFNLDEIHERLARIALDLIRGSSTVYISLFNQLAQEIKAVYSIHDGKIVDVTVLPPARLSPAGEGTQSEAIHTGKPVIIDDLEEVNRQRKLKATKAVPEGEVTKSGIYIPMITHGKVIGVLQLQSYEKAHYTSADAELLSLVANTAAVSIENARLYDETRKNAEQLSKLNALSRELAATLSLQSIYHTTHTYVRQFLDCPNFGISLFDSLQQTISSVFLIVNELEIDVTGLSAVRHERSQAETGRAKAIITAFPVIVNDLPQGADTSMSVDENNQHEPQSGIYTPMVVDGLVIGILEIHSYQKDAYSAEDAELLSTIAHQIGLSIQNARLFTQIEHQLRQLSALRTIDNAISSNTDLNTTLSIILEHVKSELGVDAADILLFKPETMTLEHAANRGFHTDMIQRISLRLGEGIAGKTAVERKAVLIEDLANADNRFHYGGLLSTEQFVTYGNAPLISKGQLKGVLEVFHRSLLKTDREWLTFLEMMGNEAAIAIDNGDLFNELQRSNLDLTIAYDATIEGWAQALELRDSETEGHSRRVTEMTLHLARQMNIQGLELVHIRRGSLLHDIGKMGVPDYILRKPGPLSEGEWQIMRQHPVLAHNLLSRIPYLRPALDIPYNHHEHWDGNGYPRKLRGEQIPLSARIFSVADVYDALTSDRPYRRALEQKDAFKYIREQVGKHFDPQIAEIFLKMMDANQNLI